MEARNNLLNFLQQVSVVSKLPISLQKKYSSLIQFSF